jgi:excisionase family DNA binding protein
LESHARGSNAPRFHQHCAQSGQGIADVLPVEVQKVTVVVELDPYLSLKALAAYSGLGVTRLRAYLTDVRHPLPHYRVGGKILIRRSTFDHWMEQHNATPDMAGIVNEVVADMLH